MTGAPRPGRLDRWCWILIYVGIFTMALGIAVQRSASALGWGISLTGSALIAVGLVLIWIRSRITEDSP